jgi:hypothetical protein
VATGFLPDFKMFFDNNFLFFVTMTATLDEMAAIVTKNRFVNFFLNSLNIVKNQCCYQTIKEQCIYNSLSDHE